MDEAGDNFLKRTLKDWAGQRHPPEARKALLLRAAKQAAPRYFGEVNFDPLQRASDEWSLFMSPWMFIHLVNFPTFNSRLIVG